MKKSLILLATIIWSMMSYSQVNDEYRKFADEYNSSLKEMKKENDDFKAKANAEFAEFVAKEWKLFEDFKAEQLSMKTPKPKEIPIADKKKEKNVSGDSDIEFKSHNKLPAVTNVSSSNEKTSSLDNGYVIKRRIGDEGKQTTTTTNTQVKTQNVTNGPVVDVNFYGCIVSIPFDSKLRTTSKGYKEQDIANYINDMSNNGVCTKALWDTITSTIDGYGLNEWGYYCLLKSISDKVFKNDNDKVMFCFYMLRNEGNFKTRIARGKDIGLQYEGHVATAVNFGDGFKMNGDGFTYGEKKYYVCDPTYINASVGMTMPQFAGKTPKVIKLKKAAN